MVEDYTGCFSRANQYLSGEITLHDLFIHIMENASELMVYPEPRDLANMHLVELIDQIEAGYYMCREYKTISETELMRDIYNIMKEAGVLKFECQTRCTE